MANDKSYNSYKIHSTHRKKNKKQDPYLTPKVNAWAEKWWKVPAFY